MSGSTTLLRQIWFAFAFLLLSAGAQAREAPRHAKPDGAAIASAHALATDAGFEILGKGGNAFDAAVAVSSTLSVVEPISSGLGGGGFFLLHDAKTGKDVFVDARETSPVSATSQVYLDEKGELNRDRATNGPWAAGIPGLPAALVHVAEKYGRLPLKDSLAPAIRIAHNGFPMYARLVRGYGERREVMERYPGTRAVFLKDGRPLLEGELLRQPELAQTLQLLADKGFDGFYRGQTAQKLLAGVKAEGGDWTAEELAAYRVKEREPIRFKYHDWDIVTAPPTSSGGIALAEMLQMLEPWDLQKMDEATRVHLVVESMRRAFHDRTFYLGDPDFAKIPQATLLSPYYAAGLRSTINPQKATPSDLLPGEPTPFEEHPETTHFSIIDADGNRAAVTQTVNLLFGSGLIPPGTGVLLNNEMDDFALKPGTPNAFGVMGFSANAPEPGKRMLSSMTPTFMTSPERVAVLGTPGGTRIITMVLLGVLGFDGGLDAQQVVALPRYHHQWLPDIIGIEKDALTPESIAKLRAMGHTVLVPGEVRGQRSSDAWGNMQAVEWDVASGQLRAGSDPRNPVGKGEVKSKVRARH